MKHTNLLTVFLLLILSILTANAQHDYVDLGLPSGTLWATTNVGAINPADYGDYFAWGETQPKSDYSWSTYKWCKGSENTLTKYCDQRTYGYNGFTDGLTRLLSEDDAATANWGSEWQMPSKEQFQELINSDYTTREWTAKTGKEGFLNYGILITSKINGKSIFLPASGRRDGTSLEDDDVVGAYYSCLLTSPYIPYSLTFNSNKTDIMYIFRYAGLSVRPVRVPEREVYTEFIEETGTLTYYYDNLRESRSGITEVYDPASNPFRFEKYGREVLKAVIDPSMKNAHLTSVRRMFVGYNFEYNYRVPLEQMTTIEGLENLNTEDVTDMSYMFDSCYSLTSLNVSSFNTANVKDMKYIFCGCESLTSIDLSSFNTANVTDMSDMFYYCKSLTSLDVSFFNTANVTNMMNMFRHCESLTSLDLSFFNTAKVKDMRYMFCDCPNLMYLDVSSFNTAKVTCMESMFNGCKNLTSLDLSSFNTAQVTSMFSMFYKCQNLTTIYCDNDWSTSSASSTYMFDGCNSLVGGKGTKYNDSFTDKTYARPDGGTSNPGYFTFSIVKEVYTEFVEATGTLTYYYDNLRTNRSGVTEVYDPVNNPNAVRFKGYNDKVLKAVIDPSMKKAHLTSMQNMFNGFDNFNFFLKLSNLKSIVGLENLNTTNVTDMRYMFSSCESLTSLDLSSFNTAKVTQMTSMFTGCSNLTSVNLNSFSTAKVTDMSYMFYKCSNLTTIFCDNDWSGNAADSRYMFYDCSLLTGGNGTTYSDSFTDATYARPDGGTNKPGYFTSSQVKEVYTEFVEATGTLTYYYDNLRTSREGVTELYDPVNNPNAVRFKDYNEKVLKAVIDPSMKKAHLTSMQSMFNGLDGNNTILNLSKLESIVGLENLNTENVTDMSYMFNKCYSLTSLDLSSFNTARVTNMKNMFSGCSNLTSLNLSSFNTANVTDIRDMFSYCANLTSLDLSSFNTAKVTSMSYMFYYCRNLTTIFCDNDWSGNATYSDYMFLGCYAIVGGKGTKYNDSFTDKTYARPDGGTSKPGYFTSSQDVKEVYTEFVEATGTLTYYYDGKREKRTGVTELYDPVGNPDVARFTGYFKKVVKAVIDPSMKDAPLTSMRSMFYGGMNPETWVMQSLRNMTTIEGLENLNTATVTDMNSMFAMCEKLTTLDLSTFNTSNVTTFNGMFTSCDNLELVDVTSFDISKVTDMEMMFISCPKLTTICCFNDWSTTTAKSNYMFSGCKSLVGDKGTVFDSNVIDKTYARPDGGTTRPGYFTSDTMTGIKEMKNEERRIKNDIYNLSGQRLQKLQKGINIIGDSNGTSKKVLIK